MLVDNCPLLTVKVISMPFPSLQADPAKLVLTDAGHHETALILFDCAFAKRTFLEIWVIGCFVIF
jgi:hypothetical protein